MSVITQSSSLAFCAICGEVKPLGMPGLGHVGQKVKHIFHDYCLMGHLMARNGCPLCNKRLVFIHEYPLPSYFVPSDLQGAFENRLHRIAESRDIVRVYGDLFIAQRDQTIRLSTRIIVIEAARASSPRSMTPCCAIL